MAKVSLERAARIALTVAAGLLISAHRHVADQLAQPPHEGAIRGPRLGAEVPGLNQGRHQSGLNGVICWVPIRIVLLTA